MQDLETGWYWMSLRPDGDIFYPVYITEDGKVKVDGFNNDMSEFEGATFNKACLPPEVESNSQLKQQIKELKTFVDSLHSSIKELGLVVFDWPDFGKE